jgi:hypothetical protein
MSEWRSMNTAAELIESGVVPSPMRSTLTDVGSAVVHTPPEHVPAQNAPHEPQFDASVRVSTQRPPHAIRPVPHVQLPPTQDVPLPHAFVQDPQ